MGKGLFNFIAAALVAGSAGSIGGCGGGDLDTTYANGVAFQRQGGILFARADDGGVEFRNSRGEEVRMDAISIRLERDTRDMVRDGEPCNGRAIAALRPSEDNPERSIVFCQQSGRFDARLAEPCADREATAGRVPVCDGALTATVFIENGEGDAGRVLRLVADNFREWRAGYSSISSDRRAEVVLDEERIDSDTASLRDDIRRLQREIAAESDESARHDLVARRDERIRERNTLVSSERARAEQAARDALPEGLDSCLDARLWVDVRLSKARSIDDVLELAEHRVEEEIFGGRPRDTDARGTMRLEDATVADVTVRLYCGSETLEADLVGVINEMDHGQDRRSIEPTIVADAE